MRAQRRSWVVKNRALTYKYIYTHTLASSHMLCAFVMRFFKKKNYSVIIFRSFQFEVYTFLFFILYYAFRTTNTIGVS